MPIRVVVLAAAVAACTGCAGPGSAVPSDHGPVLPSARELGADEVALVTAPEAPALRDLPPRTMTELRRDAEVTPFLREAWGAALAPGSDRTVVFGFGRGWVAGDDGKRRPAARQNLYAAAFSPDGALAALVGADDFLVVDAGTGRRVRAFAIDPRSAGSPETRAVRFLSAGELAFFDGCRLRRARVDGGEVRAVGPELCGRPHASDDGRRWLVWDQSENGAVTVHVVDADTGAADTVLGGLGSPGLSAFAAAPDAGAFCFSRHRDRSALTCRVLGGAETVVWEGVTDGRAAFLGPRRLVFGAGPLRSERPLVVVDLEAGTRQVVGTLGAGEEWVDALSPERVLASGGDRVLLFDLAAGTLLHIALGAGEWEGLVSRPGAERFLIGRERRATRDLYWVAIPR